MTSYVDDDPKDEPLQRYHPSFGMVRVSRRSGHAKLFGVDYPQQHYIALEISGGKVETRHGDEFFYAQEQVVVIEMSEVQYARMIATPNTTGVPCTLKYHATGPMEKIEDPPLPADGEAVTHGDLKETAKKIAGNFEHVEKALLDMAAGKAPTKAELRALASVVQQARQGIASDLPFYVKQAVERVTKVTESGKAEVDAYVHHTLAELGREALGEKIRKGGVVLRLGERKPAELEGPKDGK